MKRRRVWWIAGAAFVLLTTLAFTIASSQGRFLSRLSAILKAEGFEQVSTDKAASDYPGHYYIAEFELKLSGGEDSVELMTNVAEQFGVENQHIPIKSHYPLITERFTVEEDGTTYYVYLEQQDFYKVPLGRSLPESYLVVVRTDAYQRATMLDWIKGMWPW